jgi:hypothetical protein
MSLEGGDMAMKKLLVYIDEERLEDLRMLAQRHNTSMADLIRFALEEVFEDDLDAMSGQRAFEEHLADPSGSISLDDYLKERGIVLPGRASKSGKMRSKAAARSG